MAAFLKKPALDLLASSSLWNLPYWLGEFITLFFMGLQLVIARNSKWSTTATRTTIVAAGVWCVPSSPKKRTTPNTWGTGTSCPLNTNIGPKALSVTTETKESVRDYLAAAADKSYKLCRELP
ncbi:hypothetical protein TEQG_02034 [Trichophyton equinum CBS 127.97]|uniref:Uncharacterized protein n=1 Tax=Trichophyton equinum (strain ATCC MYA-4606 / CBS 127.97) TaxID=559882 RepID=F2PMA0_TRIEC|nr:hypothetical protein TEQG_02034 [Trichophyton equinum CBS 127.97]